MKAEIKLEFDGRAKRLTRELGEMMMRNFEKVGGEISWNEEENEGVMSIKEWEEIDKSYIKEIVQKIESDFDDVKAEIKSIER